VFDGFLAAEFAAELLCEYGVFEPTFECPFEHFRLRKATSLGGFSNSAGHFGGHTM
jgi:hypothetical protein